MRGGKNDGRIKNEIRIPQMVNFNTGCKFSWIPVQRSLRILDSFESDANISRIRVVVLRPFRLNSDHTNEYSSVFPRFHY